jgi:hypothetical protein
VSNAHDEEEPMADTSEKLGQIVPELFFDVIARVVPGTAFLMVCLWHRTDEKLDFTTTLGVLFVAYTIGITVDVLSSVITSFLEPRIKFVWPSYVPDSEIWEPIFAKAGSRHSRCLKMMAEQAMFRTSLFLSIVFFFWRPPAFAELNYYPLYVASCSIALLICYARMHWVVACEVKSRNAT